MIYWDLTLDDVSIGDRVQSISIMHDQGAVHNTIDVSAADQTLYPLVDPLLRRGQARLVFYIGSRAIAFLLEERGGNESGFSFSGRTLSALDETDYRHNIDYRLTSPRLASVVAQEMLGHSLQWELVDWALPKSFSFAGNPVEGVLSLARKVGGVLRCLDDGALLARPKWAVRPIDLAGVPALVPYDRIDNLMALTSRVEAGTHENRVTVNGYSENLQLPAMELQESGPVRGQDVHVRVFWGNLPPCDVVGRYVSDGAVLDLGFYNDEYEDEVTFVEGKATLPRPVHALNSVRWHGTPAAPVDYTVGEKVLVSEKLWGLATIKYKSVYHKYRLYGHDQKRLLLALAYSGGVNAGVTVRFNRGEANEAASITEGTLTTTAACRARGVAYLDDHFYDFRRVSIEAPYHEAAVDGVVVNLADTPAEAVGKYYVESCAIQVDGPVVTNRLEVVQPVI